MVKVKRALIIVKIILSTWVYFTALDGWVVV